MVLNYFSLVLSQLTMGDAGRPIAMALAVAMGMLF